MSVTKPGELYGSAGSEQDCLKTDVAVRQTMIV
jgi:hypothetical protein